MIVGYSFIGDTNETLKWVQHDCYQHKVAQLFTTARDRYVRACRFIGVTTDLFQQIVKLKGFDHRVLQDAHDGIAAYYRFAHDDGGQMTLFPLEKTIRTVFFDSDRASYKDKLLWKWSQFYNEEVERLVEDDDIALAILTAVVYFNTPKGSEAEDRLAMLLKERYGELVIKESESDLSLDADGSDR